MSIHFFLILSINYSYTRCFEICTMLLKLRNEYKSETVKCLKSVAYLEICMLSIFSERVSLHNYI